MNKTGKFLITLTIVSWLLFFIAIVSTTVILINDNLSWQGDSKGFSNFLSIFRFPISLLISLLAVLTLRLTTQRFLQTEKQLELLNQQIRATRQPNLFVDNRKIWIYTYPDNQKEKQIIVSRIKDNEDRPDFSIWNVGVATAIQVNIKFEFDVSKAIELVKTVDENKIFEMDNSIKGIVTLRHKNSKYQCYTSNNLFFEEDYINFVPAGYSDKCLYIPKIFIELYLIFLSLLCIDNEEIEYPFRGRLVDKGINEFPYLYLTFLYSDIGNIRHKTGFKINPVFDKFQNPFVYGNFRITENQMELNVVPSE